MSNKKCPNCGYELDSWNDCVSVNNILECPECEEHFELKAVRLNNPSLTIPKSIADELDGVFAGIDATDIGYVLDQTGPYGSRTFNDYYFKNKNIIALYLAGKALGVDLVKVVEG